MYACILPHHYFSIDIRLNYFIKERERGRGMEGLLVACFVRNFKDKVRNLKLPGGFFIRKVYPQLPYIKVEFGSFT